MNNVQSNVEFLTNRLDSITSESKQLTQPPPVVVDSNYNFDFSPAPKLNLSMHNNPQVDESSILTSSTLPAITSSSSPLQHSSPMKFDVKNPIVPEESLSTNYENFVVESSPNSYPPSSEPVEAIIPSGKMITKFYEIIHMTKFS